MGSPAHSMPTQCCARCTEVTNKNQGFSPRGARVDSGEATEADGNGVLGVGTGCPGHGISKAWLLRRGSWRQAGCCLGGPEEGEEELQQKCKANGGALLEKLPRGVEGVRVTAADIHQKPARPCFQCYISSSLIGGPQQYSPHGAAGRLT